MSKAGFLGLSFLVLLIPAAGFLVRPAAADVSIYTFNVEDINGEMRSLSEFRGQPILIVNTASQCGFTPQYAGLEELYERYRDQGLHILAFPSNDFGGQEPGSNAEIREFCNMRFHITFDLFSKIKVTRPGIHPLFEYLTTVKGFEGPVKWNFNKFLIGKNGELVARFDSPVEPLSDTLVDSVEAALRS